MDNKDRKKIQAAAKRTADTGDHLEYIYNGSTPIGYRRIGPHGEVHETYYFATKSSSPLGSLPPTNGPLGKLPSDPTKPSSPAHTTNPSPSSRGGGSTASPLTDFERTASAERAQRLAARQHGQQGAGNITVGEQAQKITGAINQATQWVDRTLDKGLRDRASYPAANGRNPNPSVVSYMPSPGVGTQPNTTPSAQPSSPVTGRDTGAENPTTSPSFAGPGTQQQPGSVVQPSNENQRIEAASNEFAQQRRAAFATPAPQYQGPNQVINTIWGANGTRTDITSTGAVIQTAANGGTPRRAGWVDPAKATSFNSMDDLKGNITSTATPSAGGPPPTPNLPPLATPAPASPTGPPQTPNIPPPPVPLASGTPSGGGAVPETPDIPPPPGVPPPPSPASTGTAKGPWDDVRLGDQLAAEDYYNQHPDQRPTATTAPPPTPNIPPAGTTAPPVTPNIPPGGLTPPTTTPPTTPNIPPPTGPTNPTPSNPSLFAPPPSTPTDSNPLGGLSIDPTTHGHVTD